MYSCAFRRVSAQALDLTDIIMQSGATVVGLVGTGLGLLGKVSQLDQCQAVTQSRVESSEVKAEKSEAKVKHRFEKLEQKIDALDSKLQKKVDKLEQEN